MLEITLELKNTILDTFKIDKDEITIGRNSANDITIDNLAVSDTPALSETKPAIIWKISTAPTAHLWTDARSAASAWEGNRKSRSVNTSWMCRPLGVRMLVRILPAP